MKMWLHIVLKGGSSLFVPKSFEEGDLELPIETIFTDWIGGASGRKDYSALLGFPCGVDHDEVQTMAIRPFSNDPYIHQVELIGQESGGSEEVDENGVYPCGHTEAEHQAGLGHEGNVLTIPEPTPEPQSEPVIEVPSEPQA